MPQGIFALAGKAEQLIGEIGRIRDRIFDSLDVLVIRIVFFSLQSHQRGISLNTHQQVIKIVGDTAGKCPNGFHFLRMDQLRFQLLFFPFGLNPSCDIPRNVENDVASPIDNRPGLNFHRNQFPVGSGVGSFQGNLYRTLLLVFLTQLLYD